MGATLNGGVNISTCWTCGYSWPTGQNGDHSCAEHLRKDAMRYRWLRTHRDQWDRWEMKVSFPENLDAMIDELMVPVIDGSLK